MNDLNIFFHDLFNYNHHINLKLAEVFQTHSDKVSKKSFELFSHIHNAHQIWNCRIEEKENTIGVWEIQKPEKSTEIIKSNYEVTMRILTNYDLSKTINYKNSKGQAFSNNIKEILFHIINHSTYHRGQIATDFKKNGIEPLITDYIFYKR